MAEGSTTVASDSLAAEKKRQLDQNFFKKGILVALFSGLLYGFYTAFITAAQNTGAWVGWATTVTAGSFLAVFILPAIASTLNDGISAVWALIITAAQGKLADFGRTLETKPGVIMICAAAVGGPIASVAYVIALSQAGTLAVPIAALNPAVGAILARVLYKQPLKRHMVAGIVVCVIAGVMIGSTGLTGDVPAGTGFGLALAFLAAVGWGAEGCIAGYGTAMIDSQIGITIRQTTSGILNLIVVLPVLTLVGAGSLGETFGYVGDALTDLPSLVFFILSGLCAYLSFARWYRGNSMCGTALGMACNGTYTFHGPFFTWLIVGLAMGINGYALAPIAWIAAAVMVVGIFLVAVNPADYLSKKEQ